MMQRPLSWVTLWAVLGVGATFVEAIWRLGLRARATLGAGLGPGEWLAFALLTAGFVYGEGHRALARRFVPAVIERAFAAEHSGRLHRWLAPLYAMSLVGAPAPLRLRAWAAVLLIVAAVVLVRSLPEPYRGIVDGAVAAALLWGLCALCSGLLRASRMAGTLTRSAAARTMQNPGP